MEETFLSKDTMDSLNCVRVLLVQPEATIRPEMNFSSLVAFPFTTPTVIAFKNSAFAIPPPCVKKELKQQSVEKH